MSISAFIFWLLVCIAPLAAFCASNIERFTTRHLLGSCAVSIGLGALCRLAFAAFAPVWNALLGGAVFCLLSERFFAMLAPKLWGRIALFAGIIAFFGLLGNFFGLWPLAALLAVHLCFSLYDLRKNWNKPKNTVLYNARPGQQPIEIDAQPRPAPMPKKPDITILFLESLHSQKALRALYDHDDFGFVHFLEQNGFAIFPDAASNEYGTCFSLATMLNMDSGDPARAKTAPLAFQWLAANGYAINLFDCSAYTFSSYVPYVNHFNCAIPPVIERVYAFALPFILQSALLLKLAGGHDPFTDESDYQKVRRDYLAMRAAGAPTVNIIRFGAHHVGMHYHFRERAEWIPFYLDLYQKTVANAEELIKLLIERDPDGVLVAMGDHGAASLQGSWHGMQDANANMRANGFEPETVALDLTGIVMAVRAPFAASLDTGEPLTPAALFRLIFERCGVPAAELPPATPADSYLRDLSLPKAWLIRSDGAALSNWEEQNAYSRLARKLVGREEIVIKSSKELVDLGKSLEQAGKFQEAQSILRAGCKKFPDDAAAREALARVCLRMGHAREACDAVEPFFNARGESLQLFTTALACLGQVQQALRILSLSPAAAKLGQTQIALSRAGLCQIGDSLDHCLVELQHCAKGADLYENNAAVALQAFCLDALGDTAQALKIVEDWIAGLGNNIGAGGTISGIAIGLAMRLGEYASLPARFETYFELDREPHPVTIYLWQAGVFEQLGRNDEAMRCLRHAMTAREPAPMLRLQQGLFALRHHLHNPDLREAKNEAYAYLRQQGKYLEALADQDWLTRQYGARAARQGMKPLAWYLHFGRVLALDFRPGFNNAYYCLTNPDLFRAGYDPLWHFLFCPAYENRDPSFNFSMRAYMARHPDIDWAKENPLVQRWLAENGARINHGADNENKNISD